jgi:hypothetical protein
MAIIFSRDREPKVKLAINGIREDGMDDIPCVKSK